MARSNCRLPFTMRTFFGGIEETVLRLEGTDTATGGSEDAARLLERHVCADTTFINRTSQVLRWIQFFDEDMRQPLPATEGDVLAFIGYLSLEGRVSGTFLPQYVSAVSR